jgi:GTP-binding protein HflX
LTGEARTLDLTVPMADGQKLAWLHAHGEILSEQSAEDALGHPASRLRVRLTPRELGRFYSL